MTGRLLRRSVARPVVTKFVLAAVPAAYGLVLGVKELQVVRPLPLDPDVQMFLGLADSWGVHELWGGAREPLWPAAAAVATTALGDRPTVMRLLGLLGFLALILCVQFAATRLYGSRIGWAAGMMTAASPWLVTQAPRGLREESAAAIVVAILALLRRPTRSPRRIVFTFVVVAAAALLRWDTLGISLPLLTLSAIGQRWPLKSCIAGTLSFLALTSGLLIGNAVTHGDPMYHANVHAVFFRNIEFVGQPGLPTAAELKVNPFAGPPETWFHYLFVRRGVKETAGEAVSGSIKTIRTVPALGLLNDGSPAYTGLPTLSVLATPPNLVVLTLLAAVGAGCVRLVRRGLWLLPAALVLSVVQHAPIANLMDFRLALTVFPMMVLTACAAVPGSLSPAEEGRSSMSPGL
jgi:hypothetical protein